jgi:hypothetical protein
MFSGRFKHEFDHFFRNPDDVFDGRRFSCATFLNATFCCATFWVGRRFVARRFGTILKNDVLSRDVLSRDVLSGDVLPWYHFLRRKRQYLAKNCRKSPKIGIMILTLGIKIYRPKGKWSWVDSQPKAASHESLLIQTMARLIFEKVN